MALTKLFDKIRSSFNGGSGASLSFGEATQVGDMHVIPVARVQYGFGGGMAKDGSIKVRGADKKETTDKEPKDQEAFGGGGGCRVDPIGIFTLKDERVRFFPILGIRELIALFSLATFMLFRLGRLKKKKR